MVGSGLEDEIGNWVPGNEADLSLGSLDFFNFPSVSLEGDGLDEGDWDAKLRDIELYTSDSFLDAPHGDILNAASKLKQEPPSEFAEEAPRTRILAHNGYPDGLDSRDNQAPSPDSVLNSNHSSSGEKGVSKISEDLIPPQQPYSSQSHDSSAPRRSKRVASKPVYRSFNYPDFYIPETVACFSEEQPQKKKKRKLSKVSDIGKVPLCSSQHTKCSRCDATETIEWREGPLGPKILCNSCGIQYRYGRLFPEYHPAAKPTFDSSLQTMFSMKGSDPEEKTAVYESHLILDDEVPELETESKMSMSSDDFEFYPSESGVKGKSSKRKLNKRVKVTMQTSSPSGNQRCLHCDVGKTTQWREGPMGPRTLCNACGIRYRSGRLFPEYRPADSPTFVPSLHSFSHRKVIELRKKALQEASVVFKEPILTQPKLTEETAITSGTLLISPSKEMKEEAIIAKEPIQSQTKLMEETAITTGKLLISPSKNMKEEAIQDATNLDMEPPLQPLGAIEETVFADSKPQVLSCEDMKEAAIADSEPLFSLPNDTKEVSAEIAVPMSLPCKDMKETSFIGIEPPFVPSKDNQEAIKTDKELLSSRIKDMKEVAIVTKAVMSSPNATKEAVVAIREPPLHLKAIQEAVMIDPRPRISPFKALEAMEEVIIADEETILSAPEVVKKTALTEINHSLSRHGGSELSVLNGKNSVKRIRKKDKEKKDENKEKKKKLPKLSGIAGTSKKSLVKPAVTIKCLHCGINKSPLWREGPLGRKTLCNACGLRYASGRLFPEYRPAASPSFVPDLHSNSHKKVVQLRQEEAVAAGEVSTHYSMLFNSGNL